MRKSILFLLFVISLTQVGFAQNQTYFGDQLVRKGRFFVYWGWNRMAYTASSMHFSGKDYDFTLDHVRGWDHQTRYDPKLYFKPKNFTEQQFNFRLGYFFREKWTVSIGRDHMKYVIDDNLLVRINGHIGKDYGPLEREYEDDIITIGNYMHFGYPAGLDYWNVGLRRFDQVLNLNKVRVCLTEGVGIGGLRSDIQSKLLNFKPYSDRIWTGYGANVVMGLRVSFFDKFFVQTEAKGGYFSQIQSFVNDRHDKVEHSFFFAQANFLVGSSYLFKRRNY